MEEEEVILGSNSPDADVLIYSKNRAYYSGNLEVQDEGNTFTLELNDNGTSFKAFYEYTG